MDLIHKFLNIALPLLSVIVLLFLLPPYLFWKFIRFVIRSIYRENVAGKVILITGASSGIGEYVGYEYAKRGACLALFARREDRLRTVADKARELGSPDVIVICGDVSAVDNCRRFVDETMNHFGRLDHLVNNAGIAPISMFEDYTNVDNQASTMNINFWGSIRCTHLALPHLRKNKGKIIVIASCAGWLPTPRFSIYSASKAALVRFYETLRIELGSDVGITIIGPGLVDSEITQAEFKTLTKVNFVPPESTEGCAKAIFNSTCRGERYMIEPAWVKVMFLWKMLCPEALEWSYQFLVCRSRTSQSDATTKK